MTLHGVGDIFVSPPVSLLEDGASPAPNLVPGPIPGGVINWTHSPDFKYVYYTTGGAEPQAWRVRLADHKVELITSLKDLTRATGAYFNARIGVAPDGSAVFTRDIGTEEIYALTVKWP